MLGGRPRRAAAPLHSGAARICHLDGDGEAFLITSAIEPPSTTAWFRNAGAALAQLFYATTYVDEVAGRERRLRTAP